MVRSHLLLEQGLLLELGRRLGHGREGLLVAGVLGEEVAQGLLERADLALTLLDLLIQLVALPLQLLALLLRARARVKSLGRGRGRVRGLGLRLGLG